jgi:hypothetical protein
MECLKEIEQQGEYHTTRYIHIGIGVGIRDGKLDQCDMPSTITQRKLYIMPARRLGHHVVAYTRGGGWEGIGL